MMRVEIVKKLNAIENEQNIRILYACESGSRAWGFPSLDSDYDVRFLYVHPLDWYLSLNERKDTIEFPVNNDLDIGGWEISKALRLMAKSNMPLMEWIQSPIVYQTYDTIINELSELSIDSFSSISGMHHYLGMAQRFLLQIDDVDVKIKSYFYALRATLCCKWIRTIGGPPPMLIDDLFVLIDSALAERINALRAIKANQNEQFVIPRDKRLNELITGELALCKSSIHQLSGSCKDYSAINECFTAIIKNWAI